MDAVREVARRGAAFPYLQRLRSAQALLRTRRRDEGIPADPMLMADLKEALKGRVKQGVWVCAVCLEQAGTPGTQGRGHRQRRTPLTIHNKVVAEFVCWSSNMWARLRWKARVEWLSALLSGEYRAHQRRGRVKPATSWLSVYQHAVLMISFRDQAVERSTEASGQGRCSTQRLTTAMRPFRRSGPSCSSRTVSRRQQMRASSCWRQTPSRRPPDSMRRRCVTYQSGCIVVLLQFQRSRAVVRERHIRVADSTACHADACAERWTEP